ncbi:kmo [Symbiodinium microadriaticum]|nr:kmo [Symbiodinium microadriaticum]
MTFHGRGTSKVAFLLKLGAEALGICGAEMLQPRGGLSRLLSCFLQSRVLAQLKSRGTAKAAIRMSVLTGLRAEVAAVLGAHCFNVSAPFMVMSAAWANGKQADCHRHVRVIREAFQERCCLFREASRHSGILWMYVGSGCILFGCAGELTAHVLDGWYYGEISRFSTLNAMFNVGLTASFASLAAGMRRRQRMNAWLVVGAMLVSYWLGSKALQYFIQLLATLLLTERQLAISTLKLMASSRRLSTPRIPVTRHLSLLLAWAHLKFPTGPTSFMLASSQPLVIVGAGPVGLCTALSFKQLSPRSQVVVVERLSEKIMVGASNRWFAYGLAAPSVDFLRSLGLDIDWDSWRINGSEVHLHWPWSISKTPFLSKRNGGVSYPIRRGSLLNMLLVLARNRGITVLFDRQVERVVPSRNWIFLRGSAKPIRYRWLVGADGVHSAVRDAVAAEWGSSETFEACRSTERWMASNIPGSALLLPRDRLHIFLHAWTQATAAMYVPGEDRWSLVTSFPGHEAGALDAAQGAVQDLVGDAAADVSRTRNFGNWSLVKASKFFSPDRQILLLGDAAHAVVSHGGEGLNLGLTGVWELVRAVREEGFTDSAIESWDRAWGRPMQKYLAGYLHVLAAHGSGMSAILFKSLRGPRPKLFETSDLARMVRSFH